MIKMLQKDFNNVITELQKLGLNNYQAKALATLFSVDSCKATDLSRLSEVPKAKIYNVLDELCELRLVKKIQTKPAKFKAFPPREAFENLKRIELEKVTEKFSKIEGKKLDMISSLYGRTKKNVEQDFLEVIKIGKTLEFETKQLIKNTKKEIKIISKVLEYFPSIKKELTQAINNNIQIKVLLLNRKFLTEESKKVQDSVINELDKLGICHKFSQSALPIRFNIIDPSPNNDSGQGIIVVEEKNLPNTARYAILTKNGSFISGLNQFFNFLWVEKVTQK